MSFALCYWVLMLAWLVFGLWTSDLKNLKQSGGSLLLFLLLTLVGYKVFGPPIHD